MAYEIHRLSAADIPLLTSLQPLGWGDIRAVFRQHIGRPYFIGIKIIAEKKMIGVGQLVMNKEYCWLGNIITHTDFRRKGIGVLITKELIRIGKEEGAHSILLIATQLGEPLYKKLGFEFVSNYLFFRNPAPASVSFSNPNIRPARSDDHAQILSMDKMASGEDRHLMLQFHFDNCFVHSSNTSSIDGFHMPDLGEGLIVAQTTAAGFQLFEKRQSAGKPIIVIPKENFAMRQILEEKGYQAYREAQFMKIGPMKSWRPEMIYGHIGGNLG